MTMMLVKLRTVKKISRPMPPFDGRGSMIVIVGMSMVAAWMDAAIMRL